MTDETPRLSSWNDMPATSAIVDYVRPVTSDGAEFPPLEDRVGGRKPAFTHSG